MSRPSTVKWDKDKIIQALLCRRAQALGLNTGAIQKQYPALSGAIYSHFQSHDAALLAAGIDPESVRKAVWWNRPKVVAALQARVAAGLHVNARAIEQDEQRLSGAIHRCFGSHDKALRAAGINPGSVRLTLSEKWDRPAVVTALRERNARGLGLNQNAVLKSNPPLSYAAKHCFGSHDAALQAAGIDPAPIRKHAQWDKDKIIREIRSRRARGLSLNHGAVARSDSALAAVMVNYFQTYDSALHAAGIDPASVRQRMPPWDKHRVIAALRDRDERGQALSPSALKRSQPSLRTAIRVQFGAYDAALQAAGIDPSRVRVALPPMQEHEVLVALRQRQESGLDLNVAAIRDSDGRLVGAMTRRFGSHDAALRAAGIDPLSVRKRNPMSDDEILAALRALARDGALCRKWIESANRRVFVHGKKRFGSMEAAVTAAGLRYIRCPDDAGSAGHWTGKNILRTLRDLHQAGHDLRYRHMKNNSQPVFYAARKLFGSYVNAVKQAGINYWEMSQAQLAKERAAGGDAAKRTSSGVAH